MQKDTIELLSHLGISEPIVTTVLLNPDRVDRSYLNRRIAQGPIDGSLLLRVVFEEINNTFMVITISPASRRRYRK